MKKALTKLKNSKLKLDRVKKEKKFLIRISLFFIISFLAYSLIHTFQDYFRLEDSLNKQNQKIAKIKVKKFDNIEAKIFDLNPDNKDEVKIVDLEDLTNYDSKQQPESQDDISQDITNNDDKINQLEEEINLLKEQIQEIKQSSKHNATLISYVYLRQKIFANANNNMSFYEELKNFELLALKDQFLVTKLDRLKSILRYPLGHQYLITQFDVLIDNLIANKPLTTNKKLLDKIYQNLQKVILVRKINNTKKDSIDNQILKLQQALNKRQYVKANHILLAMDNNYKIIASAFIMDLNHLIAFERIDNEILNYLATK